MKVINIMLGRKLGGIEQAFIDYGFALKAQGIDVINVTSVLSSVNSKTHIDFVLPNFGSWDFISRLYLFFIILFTKPDLIIAHGNRAMSFVRKPIKTKRVVGVAHNYNLKELLQCDYIIALTEHMKEHLIANKFAAENVEVIPNMINIESEFVAKNYNNPVILGTMSRFVQKKGVDILLRSVAQLNKQHYDIKLIIAGSGEEKNNLIKLAKKLQLEKQVSFIGWVGNKENFFNSIDIFCLPSLHEPFGIIILEAMANSTPIIATSAEGPSEILRNKHDSLLCEVGSVDDLTAKIAYLLVNQSEARRYAENAYKKVITTYDSLTVGREISNYLNFILKDNN